MTKTHSSRCVWHTRPIIFHPLPTRSSPSTLLVFPLRISQKHHRPPRTQQSLDNQTVIDIPGKFNNETQFRLNQGNQTMSITIRRQKNNGEKLRVGKRQILVEQKERFAFQNEFAFRLSKWAHGLWCGVRCTGFNRNKWMTIVHNVSLLSEIKVWNIWGMLNRFHSRNKKNDGWMLMSTSEDYLIKRSGI